MPVDKCVCGGPVREIAEGLYKCYFCGQVLEDRGYKGPVPRRMEVYPSVDNVRAAASGEVYEVERAVPSEGGLDPDMVTFIRRLQDELLPLDYEDPKIRARVLKVRRELKNELTDVFEGRAAWDDWFTKWRRNLNLHYKSFIKVIFEALKDLKSPEAQELRTMYGQVLQRPF